VEAASVAAEPVSCIAGLGYMVTLLDTSQTLATRGSFDPTGVRLMSTHSLAG
jgi:hypothetical protein